MDIAPKRILLVEDHPAFRESLVQILRAEPNLMVVGQADNAKAALAETARLQPDLVLVGIALPEKSGLALIKNIRAVNQSVKLVVLSARDEALYANRALRCGADGYILKQEDPGEIADAIRDVLAGHIYVSERVMNCQSNSGSKPGSAPGASPSQNTDPELEALQLLGLGKTNRQIAAELGLTEPAVRALCGKLKKKLKLKNNNELIRYAVRWVESGKM